MNLPGGVRVMFGTAVSVGEPIRTGPQSTADAFREGRQLPYPLSVSQRSTSPRLTLAGIRNKKVVFSESNFPE